MWSFLNVFKQSPQSLKTGVLLVLAALVVQGTINLSGEQTAAWGLALERILEWFYVTPVTQANLESDLRALDGG